MIHRNFPPLKGFTLIELLVTMAIFITVITIAIGALFSAQAINVRLEQTQMILDEVNLSMEVMVRDIRYGTTFYCDTTVPFTAPTTRKSCAYAGGGTVLIFRPVVMLEGSTNRLNDRVAYYIENGALYKKEYPFGGVTRITQMTSTNVTIKKLTFFVTGAESKNPGDNANGLVDNNQPLTTISLSGVTIPYKLTTQPVSFSVQSSASSRDIDN